MGFLSFPKDAITDSEDPKEQLQATEVAIRWSNRCKVVFFSAIGVFIVSCLIMLYMTIFSTE